LYWQRTTKADFSADQDVAARMLGIPNDYRISLKYCGARGMALMSAEESPEPPYGQPCCIKCNGLMSLAKIERRSVFSYHYELRTFRCNDCAFTQTYTMGRS
jgi:hypothetical protein